MLRTSVLDPLAVGVVLSVVLLAGCSSAADPPPTSPPGAAGPTNASSPIAGNGTADPTVARPACDGMTIDAADPVVATSEIDIQAPATEVWRLHTDIESWPTWKSDVSSAQRLDEGPLRAGSTFRWSNGGLDITSTVKAVETNRCILWSGPGGGIDGVHLWTFTASGTSTAVHTEESWAGARVEADPVQAKTQLTAALDQGCADLKTRAEAR